MYAVMLHFEEAHTEDSPFVTTDSKASDVSLEKEPTKANMATATASNEEDEWVQCPEEDCGEMLSLVEFNDHLDLHASEKLSFDDTASRNIDLDSVGRSSSMGRRYTSHNNYSSSFSTDISPALRRKDGDPSSSAKSVLSRSVLDGFGDWVKAPFAPKRPMQRGYRLGKRELGPHAFEEQMPRWLYRQLEQGPKITRRNIITSSGRLAVEEEIENEDPGVMNVLAQLIELDRSVKTAYLCHPAVIQVSKLPNEGGFCGYRNIQMLVSYIQGAKAYGYKNFPGRMPGILELQDHIERAWNMGIDDVSRVQTGGIKGTRKYIGTPE
ncbi:hypothetical protein LTS18_009661, partial [Coniosporium uncinatum]